MWSTSAEKTSREEEQKTLSTEQTIRINALPKSKIRIQRAANIRIFGNTRIVFSIELHINKESESKF